MLLIFDHHQNHLTAVMSKCVQVSSCSTAYVHPASTTTQFTQAEPRAPQQTTVMAGPSSFQQSAPLATASTWPYTPMPRLNPLKWVPFTAQTVVADYLRRGHPSCVRYNIMSWPESVLPVAHWEYFQTLSATTPSYSTIILRIHPDMRLELRASTLPGHITVADILRSLYSVRDYFPNATIIGLSPKGLNHFIVHLDS